MRNFLVDVESTVQGTTSVIAVRGEIDVSSVGRVQAALDRALSQRPETVVLDLDAVSFCDSSGIHAVVRAHHRATERAARLVVVRPSGPAWRTFEITQIDRCVQFVDANRGGATPAPAVPA